MKTNGNCEVVARIARRSLACTALLAAALIFASVGRAQSSPASPSAAAAKPAAAAPAKPTPSPAAKPPSKGSQEGIKVHGHWTLEVKNPDGSLARRVEFENNLTTATNFAGGTFGAQALVALLSGNASLAPGSNSFNGTPWLIELLSYSFGDASPCEQPDLVYLTGIFGEEDGIAYVSCDITSTTVAPPANTTIASLNNTYDFEISSLPIQLTISGTTTPAVQQGTIDEVITIITLVQGSSRPFYFPFTVASLPAQNSGLCGGANQPPCAVGVGVGQTVMATVTFSFQ